MSEPVPKDHAAAGSSNASHWREAEQRELKSCAISYVTLLA
jgi:hypothetical protein